MGSISSGRSCAGPIPADLRCVVTAAVPNVAITVDKAEETSSPPDLGSERVLDSWTSLRTKVADLDSYTTSTRLNCELSDESAKYFKTPSRYF